MASPLKEFDDPEQSYRRGYAQAVGDVLEAIKNRLSASDSAALESWYHDEILEWRLKNIHGFSNRAERPDPFPQGVRPPREKLRLGLAQEP
jgi:hypothetical protein